MERCADVVVTTRSRRKSGKNLRYVQGDAHNAAFLEKTLREKWDVIIDFMTYETHSFENRVDLLLDSTEQYIFLSSARIYAESTGLLTEDSPRLLEASLDKAFLSTDDYALAKARQEDILTKRTGQNWTIIRPYITYGEDRFQLGVLEKEEWLYRAVRGRSIVFCREMLSQRTTLTHGLDVSRGIASIIGDSRALGEVLHVTSNDAASWDEVLTEYLKICERELGFRPRVFLVDLSDFQKCHPAKYRILYDRLFDREFDNRKIGKYIDPGEFDAFQRGLGNCLGKFLNAPKFKNVNWRREATKDRLAGEFTPLREIHGFKEKFGYLRSRFLI